MKFKTFLLGTLLTGGALASAKAPQLKGGLTIGPYLPAGVPGISEIIKVAALTGSLREEKGFGFEATFIRGSEDGATLNIFSGSLALELGIPEVDFLKVIVFAGMQNSYYSAVSSKGVQYPYSNHIGIHMGGGIVLPITSSLAGRAQYTIFNGPGRAVLVDFGMEWTFGGSEAEPSGSK